MQPRTSFLETIWQGTKRVVLFLWEHKIEIAVGSIAFYAARSVPAEPFSPAKPLTSEGEGRLPGTDVLIHNRLREEKLTPRTMTLPFRDEPIISSEHDGLSFDYDRYASSTEKGTGGVVCELSGVYKGWLERTSGAPGLNSPTVGGTHTLYLLSNKQQRYLELNEQAGVVDVGEEPVGNVTVKAITRSDSDLVIPKASCSPMGAMR